MQAITDPLPLCLSILKSVVNKVFGYVGSTGIVFSECKFYEEARNEVAPLDAQRNGNFPPAAEALPQVGGEPFVGLREVQPVATALLLVERDWEGSAHYSFLARLSCSAT